MPPPLNSGKIGSVIMKFVMARAAFRSSRLLRWMYLRTKEKTVGLPMGYRSPGMFSIIGERSPLAAMLQLKGLRMLISIVAVDIPKIRPSASSSFICASNAIRSSMANTPVCYLELPFHEALLTVIFSINQPLVFKKLFDIYALNS